MISPSEIEHNGIVCEVADGKVTVKVTAHSGCSSCSAASLCSASGDKEKYFEIKADDQYAAGQEVRIITTLRNGFRALILGYVLPLLVLLTVLVTLISVSAGELWAALGSLGSVAIYYMFLYLFRGKIDEKIKFKLKPAY